MAEFHFLRPAWLMLLPVLFWAVWRIGLGRGGHSGWRAVVDRALQPFVLRDGERVGQRRWPLLIALAASALGVLALAGPVWDRVEVPTFRSGDALVVALDLSQSMDAGDLEPSRLVRARLKLLDLLERRKDGDTALVVFTSNAFVVTPLTSDTRTISLMVPVLLTNIMPSSGSLIDVGIEKAAELLRQSAGGRGQILLITDASASPNAIDLVSELHDDGIVTSVLGAGTVTGAPIPKPDGGFVTDSRGDVVVPQLSVENLQRLASAGGGRFALLSVDDSDLDRLVPAGTAGGVSGAETDLQQTTEVWRDQGIWLAIALLPLLALGFRRGWVYVALAGCMVPMPRAEALEWRDLWQRPDQQGRAALEQDAPAAAAELFENPEWAAAASYRAGDFESSVSLLQGIDTVDAHYNRGNALARAGQLEAAIDAYDRALELAPDHADAGYNRELVADLLEQQQQQDGEQEQDQNEQGDAGQDGQQQDQQSGEQQQGQQQQSQQASDDAGDSGTGESQTSDASTQPEEQTGDAADEQMAEDAGQQEADTPPGEESMQAAAAPEDIEDWASEQAAEQWLRRIPQDPGGLLRRKFLYQYQELGIDQDGNRIYRGDEAEPW